MIIQLYRQILKWPAFQDTSQLNIFPYRYENSAPHARKMGIVARSTSKKSMPPRRARWQEGSPPDFESIFHAMPEAISSGKSVFEAGIASIHRSLFSRRLRKRPKMPAVKVDDINTTSLVYILATQRVERAMLMLPPEVPSPSPQPRFPARNTN